MLPLRPDEFMDRLLAAHGAEDAFEPAHEAAGTAGTSETTAAVPPLPVDSNPVLGLLAQAERLCGIDDVHLHAAAAA
jgi:hypothetical protein